jgi:outer membrane lipoprotein carrier protein
MQPNSRSVRLVMLGLCLVAGNAFAGARDELTRFTAGLKGLEGQFSQQVFDANGRAKESSSGKVAVAAPRQFRWEYVKPFAQLIVADGQKVWVYEPELQQATVRPQGEEEHNSPLVALFDPKRLDQQFDVSEEAAASDGLQWLTLTPKVDAAANFQMARLGFGPQGLARMQVLDLVGQKTEIRFDGWNRNPAFAAGTFKFVPGKDIDVVGQ